MFLYLTYKLANIKGEYKLSLILSYNLLSNSK